MKPSITTLCLALFVSLATAAPRAGTTTTRPVDPGDIPQPTATPTNHPTPSKTPYIVFDATTKGSNQKQSYAVTFIGQKGNFPKPVNSIFIAQTTAQKCHLSVYTKSNQSGAISRLGTGPPSRGYGTGDSWSSWGFYCP